jgi:hypothetical protein
VATYTVTGHPLNYADLDIAAADAVRGLLMGNGIGRSVTIVLSAPDDTEVKDLGVLE